MKETGDRETHRDRTCNVASLLAVINRGEQNNNCTEIPRDPTEQEAHKKPGTKSKKKKNLKIIQVTSIRERQSIPE